MITETERAVNLLTYCLARTPVLPDQSIKDSFQCLGKIGGGLLDSSLYQLQAYILDKFFSFCNFSSIVTKIFNVNHGIYNLRLLAYRDCLSNLANLSPCLVSHNRTDEPGGWK